jgi:NAD(P)H-hydrate epimerase
MTDIAGLLLETGHAHHKAFIETDGADPEWPLWYADYLHPRMPGALTKARIIYLLQAAEIEHGRADDGSPWPDFYAEFLTNSG